VERSVSAICREVSYFPRNTAGRQQVLLPAISEPLYRAFHNVLRDYNFFRKPVVHVFPKTLRMEGTNQKARIIAGVKIIDALILTRVW